MIHTHSSEVEQQSPSHGTAWGAKLAARRGDQCAHDLESTPDASCQDYNIFPMGIRGISHQLAPDQLLFSFSCYDQPFHSDTAKDVWVCTPNLSSQKIHAERSRFHDMRGLFFQFDSDITPFVFFDVAF